MAVTLIFVALCMAAVLFLVRFLTAISSEHEKVARVGYLVQVRTEMDGDDGGVTRPGPALVHHHPHIPTPPGRTLPAGKLAAVRRQMTALGGRGNQP